MATRAALGDCPGAEHFAWWLDAWSPGAGDSSGDLRLHLVDDTDRVNDAAFEFARVAGGDRAVGGVVGWRATRFNQIVVTYHGLDGRNYDLVAEVDPATGLRVMELSERIVQAIREASFSIGADD